VGRGLYVVCVGTVIAGGAFGALVDKDSLAVEEFSREDEEAKGERGLFD
jgi:hypothetical protein